MSDTTQTNDSNTLNALECVGKLRWIAVTERLPEAGIRYQVTFESGEVGYADFRNKIFFYDGSAKENVWEIERYYENEGEVIAWMPLPEPYRKETKLATNLQPTCNQLAN